MSPHSKERIKLEDSMEDAIWKMSKGNPGAMTVCLNLLKEGASIDPENAFAGLGLIMFMDSFGIHEHRIWMLYKDVCGECLPTTVAMLRACQLGIIQEGILHRAIDNYGEGLDIPQVIEQVKKKLPKFNPPKAKIARED